MPMRRAMGCPMGRDVPWEPVGPYWMSHGMKPMAQPISRVTARWVYHPIGRPMGDSYGILCYIA